MKKLIFALIIVATPFLSFYQGKAQEPIVKKNQAGIVQSVEFPDSIPMFKIPPSAGEFFKSFLKVSLNDEFRNIPHKE